MTFFGEYRGHGTPHESPEGHDRPAGDPGRHAPSSSAWSTSRLGTLDQLRAVRAAHLRCSPTSCRIAFNWYTAIASVALGVLGAALLSYQYWALHKGPFIGITERVSCAGVAAPGGREQVRPRRALHRLDRRHRQGPDRGRVPTGSTRTSSTRWSTAPVKARSPPATWSTATSTRSVLDGVIVASGPRRRGLRPGPQPHADRQGPAVRRAALRRRRHPRRHLRLRHLGAWDTNDDFVSRTTGG